MLFHFCSIYHMYTPLKPRGDYSNLHWARLCRLHQCLRHTRFFRCITHAPVFDWWSQIRFCMCKCIPLSVVILALHQVMWVWGSKHPILMPVQLCASRILLVQLQSFEHFLDMVRTYRSSNGSYCWAFTTRSPIFTFSAAELLMVIQVCSLCTYSLPQSIPWAKHDDIYRWPSQGDHRSGQR